MQKLILLALIGFVFMGCSSGNNDNKGATGGGVSQFAQKTAGQWISDCTQSQNGNYKENLVINANGSGSITYNFYQDQNCAGAVAQSQGPLNFTYTAEAPVNGVTKVTLTFAGNAPVSVNIRALDNSMEITSDAGVVKYTRIGQPVTPIGIPGQNGPGNTNDFDSMAKGNWVSEQCFQYQNNTTVRLVLSIAGQGAAASVLNVYQSQDCSGQAQPDQRQDFTYTVDRFSYGGGQISVKGQPSDVTFQGNRMTLTSAEGTMTYVKITK